MRSILTKRHSERKQKSAPGFEATKQACLKLRKIMRKPRRPARSTSMQACVTRWYKARLPVNLLCYNFLA